MVQIFNNTKDTYLTVQEYIDAWTESDEDVYYIQFAFGLKALFERTQRDTAYRGRFAKDEAGNSLLERYAMTVDEEDLFMQKLEAGSGDLYKKLLAWTKNLFKSYQFNATLDLAEAYAYRGEVSLYQSIPAALDIIHDYNANFVADSLVGMQVLIESGPYRGYARNITANLATSITAFDPGGNFPGDISGEAFSINNVDEISLPQAALIFYTSIPGNMYFDLIEQIADKLEEALTLYVIKEWYKITRLMDDYAIEDAAYEFAAKEVKSLMMMKTEPTRRNTKLLQ